MAEWGLAPDYIASNWTDELLDLMIAKLVVRKNKLVEAVKGGNPNQAVSDIELFRQMGDNVKWEHK